MKYFRRLPHSIALLLWLLANLGRARAATEPPPPPIVWEAKLGQYDLAAYTTAVEALFGKIEAAAGRKIAPGTKHKVGLKIYAESGPGLATPLPLTQAVIAALVRRGYAAGDIFLVGLNQRRLMQTGYLPSPVTGHFLFDGHPVYVLESNRFYNPVWFYDSPLPSRFDPFLANKPVFRPDGTDPVEDEKRKSLLDTLLFLDADFWINLPVYTDHAALGVNGALVNATLWNASNTERFFGSPGSAPAAVAEMAAIPELRQTWAFTLVSLERYQFIGGPWFNSLYTRSAPRLWLSADPVLLDALMLDRINADRVKAGFKPVSEDIRLLEFAATLGLGTRQTAGVKLVPAE
jgi:hypothetical protein